MSIKDFVSIRYYEAHKSISLPNTRLDEATKPIVSSVLAADVILCTM